MSQLATTLGFVPAYLDVPDSWDTVKAKWLFQEVKDTGHSEQPLLSVTQDHGVIPREDNEDRVWNPGNDVSHYKLVKPGQYVISLRSFEGGIEYSNISGIVSPAYVVIDPEPPVKKRQHYFRYLFKSSAFIDALKAISSGIRQGKTISFSDFAEMPLPLPPKEQARQQAEFLDSEVSKLDRLIAKNEQLAELLEERRTALITKAVTKGLDPDASMKDSGVEWLGEIPEHWDTVKVKYLAEYINGYAFSSSDWSKSGKRIIRIQNLTGSENEYNYYDGTLPEKHLAQPGDILISWSASLGAFRWHESEPAWVNQHIYKAAPHESLVDKNFFLWLAKVFMAELEREMHGSAMQHVTQQKFGALKVPLPPLDEQELIARTIEEKEAYLRTVTERVYQAIQRLEEYRSALITAAVRGKIDVRDDVA